MSAPELKTANLYAGHRAILWLAFTSIDPLVPGFNSNVP